MRSILFEFFGVDTIHTTGTSIFPDGYDFNVFTTSCNRTSNYVLYFGIIIKMLMKIELKQREQSFTAVNDKWSSKLMKWVLSKFFLSIVCMCGAFFIIGFKIADQEYVIEIFIHLIT